MFRESFEKLEQEPPTDRPQHTAGRVLRLLNIYNHAANNCDVYRLMFGRRVSDAAARVQDLLAETFLYDIRNAANSGDRFPSAGGVLKHSC